MYTFYANGTKNWGGSNRSLSAEAYNNGSGSVERLYGGFFSGGALGSGNITNLVLNNVTTYGGGTGIITNVVGVGINDLSVYNTPVNQYGIKMDNNTSAVGTNKYGLYIGNISGASSSNYSIYTGSADSYFGGNVGIGTTTPAARLDVAGNIKLSGASSSIISDGDICIGTCQ